MVQRAHRWAEADGHPAGQMDHGPERFNSRGEEQMGEALRREGGGVEVPESELSRCVSAGEEPSVVVRELEDPVTCSILMW